MSNVPRKFLRFLPTPKRILRLLSPFNQFANVSNDYVPMEPDAIGSTFENAWKDPEIPSRQRSLVDQQIASYRKSEPNPVFDALVTTLRSNIENLDSKSLIEIGCSSGYYSEVLKIKGIFSEYRGCDYSESFIKMARKKYPNIPFDVEDATQLTYGTGSFDIVISGCCILHIRNFESAVSEAARISRRHVVFHRTPVLHLGGHHYFRKKAYGVETMEIHFNEQMLVDLFRAKGMHIIGINTHSISGVQESQDVLAMKTYLCEKIQ